MQRLIGRKRRVGGGGQTLSKVLFASLYMPHHGYRNFTDYTIRDLDHVSTSQSFMSWASAGKRQARRLYYSDVLTVDDKRAMKLWT